MIYNNNLNEGISKKIIKILLFLSLICFASYFYVNKKILENEENKKGLIGMWYSNTQSQPNDGIYTINNLTFSFYEDGRCTQYGNYKIRHIDNSGGSTINVDYDGKCIFSILGNKVKVDSTSSDANYALFKNFINYSINNGKLYIGNSIFEKMPNVIDNNIVEKSVNISTEKMIGKWYLYNDGIADDVYIELNNNGTGIYYVTGVIINVKYDLADNTIVFATIGIDKKNSFILDNNKLIINNGVDNSIYIKKNL